MKKITVTRLTSSDPSGKSRKGLGRYRVCQKHEKSEVPDIIEGVPVCSGDHVRQVKSFDTSDPSRVIFRMPEDGDRQNRLEHLYYLLILLYITNFLSSIKSELLKVTAKISNLRLLIPK